MSSKLLDLVSNLLSENNETRKLAEIEYEKYTPEDRFVGLFHLMSHDFKETVFVMALVLMRRLVTSEFHSFWPKIDVDLRRSILDNLIKTSMKSDLDSSVRKPLILLMASVADELIDEETGVQKWKSIYDFLSYCAQTDCEETKCASFIFIEACPSVFGNDVHKELGGIKSVLLGGLVHPTMKVRVGSVKAATSFLMTHDEDDYVLKELQALIGPIIDTCFHVIETKYEDSALHCLADLVSICPTMFESNIVSILSNFATIAINSDVSENYRSLSMEVIVSFVEGSPEVLKHNQALIAPILKCCIFMMAELDEDTEEWLKATDEDEEDAEEIAMTGKFSLDRISTALPGSIVFPHFQQVLNDLDKNDDWKWKHAFITSLAEIGEGCMKAMSPKLMSFLEPICQSAKHSHPRVRYACCGAIGQMSVDFAPIIYVEAEDLCLSTIIFLLNDLTTPKVAAHAASALINFCSEYPGILTNSHLPSLIEALGRALDRSHNKLDDKIMKLLAEQVVTAIASVAASTEDLFKSYYSELIRSLVYIVQTSNSPESKEFRGRSVECISLIGKAVGKEMFKTDAIEIMKMLSNDFHTMAIDDPEYMYMISSWTRFCSVLGSDFIPFLPVVIEPIVRAATYEIKTEYMEQQSPPKNNVAYADVGKGEVIGIHTTGIEEKTTACNMLVCYAREMKQEFIPYVERVATAMIKNVNFKFSDSVRTSSANVMCALIECVEEQGVAAQQQLASLFIPALKRSIMEEMDLEVSGELLGSLTSIITSLQREGLTNSDIHVFVDIINHQMQCYFRFKNENENIEDDENESTDDTSEILSSFLAYISDFVHSLMKNTGGIVFRSCQSVFTGSSQLLESKIYFERKWSLHIMVDAIEFLCENIFDFFPNLHQQLYQLLQDEHADIRQTAAYGYGVLAWKSDSIKPYLEKAIDAVPRMVSLIEATEARDTSYNKLATENAISAIVRVLRRTTPETMPMRDEIISKFMHWMPVTEDANEAVHAYKLLCDLYFLKNKDFLGLDNCNIPRILYSAVSALTLGLFENDEPTKKCVTVIITSMLEETSAEVFKAIVDQAGLNKEQTEVLNRMISCKGSM